MTFAHAASVALAALFLIAATPSPRPTPTPTKAAQKVEHAGAGISQTATAQGCPANPATPAVNLTKTPDANEVAQYSSNEAGQPATPDWITLFTGVLASVAVLQLVAMLLQAYYMRRGLRLTEEAADAARDSAQTAQKVLALTQRPKLIVRNVVIRAPNPPAMRGVQLFQPRYEVSGQLYVVNVGGTDAITKECWCWGIPIRGELPMERPYEGSMGYPLTQRLRPGESMPITFRNQKEIGSEDPLIRQGSDNWAFYVMGWIAYADGLGLVRRTAFCRKWDAAKRRLLAVDDPDYEHAE